MARLEASAAPSASGPEGEARDGIGRSSVGVTGGDRRPVLDFLIARFPKVAGEVWQARLAAGLVVDEAGRPVSATEPCGAHRKLHYHREVPAEEPPRQAEALIYCDEQIAVVDKPHGMAVVPSGRHLRETLLARVRRSLGAPAATPVHRIDRDTAGLVLFSLQPASRGAYHALFRDRQVQKCYRAVAAVDPTMQFPVHRRSRIRESPGAFMQMAEVDGEPNSDTRIELLRCLPGGLGLYRLQPRTGARHQLRLHMASLGLPIVNDRIYPTLQADALGDAEALAREREAPLQLLALHLAFVDPLTGAAHAHRSRQQLLLADVDAGASRSGPGGAV